MFFSALYAKHVEIWKKFFVKLMGRLLHSTIYQMMWYFWVFIVNQFSFSWSIFFSKKLCFLWSTPANIRLGEDVLKASWRRLEDIIARRLANSSWRRLEDVLKTSWRRLAGRLENVLGRRIANTSWRRLEDIFKTFWKTKSVTLKTSWKTRNVCWDMS